MTSGSFHSIEIDSITIDREGRQRRDLSDVSDLEDSLRRLGLIHPVVVTRNLELVAGERRLTAARNIGWTNITCQYVDEIEPHTLREIELEENVKRKNLPWQEECQAVYDYHSLRKEIEPSWTLEDTSAALGMGSGRVSERLAVAKEMASGNTRVLDAPRLSTAIGIVERKKSRLDDEALRDLKLIAKPEPTVAPAPEAILNRNFNEWAPTYSGPKFNLIHCDFPYGIGADKFHQGAAPLHGGYDDSEDTYWKLCHTLATNINRVASESCHLIFWFSMHFYSETLAFFEKETDFTLDPFPLIWLKSDNVGIIPDPQRGGRRIYETAFFGSRGDRKIVRAKSNAYAAPTVRDTHMSIKPEPMLKHFFEMFVDESTIFLDPTCGSGSSVRAADSLGAAHVTGLEINPEFCEAASRAFRSAKQLRREK